MTVRRRDFVTLLGGAAAWPLAARAQQSAQPVIGFLNTGSADRSFDNLRAFRRGLGEVGFVEGQNALIEYRHAEGQIDRLPALAASLVRSQVSVVVATGSTASALAAKAATETIPVVFQIGTDPVEVGLVASLNRPQGNVTGVTLLNRELAPKRLQLLHELVPKATVIATLINPGNPSNSETQSRDYQLAAATLGLQLQILHASNEADFDAAFARLIELRVGALAIGGDAYFTSRSKELAALALHHAVPAIYQFRDFTAAGGLISYGGIGTELYRLVGAYTGRILKGERPADLPVIQSAKFELIVNLRTARILGITVPQTLLVAADEVFE
jgi:ABC-type uncharacterized transport system substrate-binding protein